MRPASEKRQGTKSRNRGKRGAPKDRHTNRDWPSLPLLPYNACLSAYGAQMKRLATPYSRSIRDLLVLGDRACISGMLGSSAGSDHRPEQPRWRLSRALDHSLGQRPGMAARDDFERSRGPMASQSPEDLEEERRLLQVANDDGLGHRNARYAGVDNVIVGVLREDGR
jgi:hypothetical protein